MSDHKTHDLFEFMRQISNEMASEYDRIQMRATEDPGTAGDQGEENWATLMRDWLPRSYEVVTKGRVISDKGAASPQVDVLVLDSTYPKKLLGKKMYLAGGVAAAFECKITLKSSHIFDAVRTCAAIKGLYRRRTGTPYRELHAPIVYGLLAHSHAWKEQGSTPAENINRALEDADASCASAPRLQLDLLCVADVATWTCSKVAYIGPHSSNTDWATMSRFYGPEGSASTAYFRVGTEPSMGRPVTPIGAFIADLSQKLAWENPSLRSLADYYRLTDVSGPGSGTMRMWPASIYSDEIRSRVLGGGLTNGRPWDEWSVSLM
jgi:hypothetical protein